jgi:23S rRNA U2552 (ribose-2'-O)-methylase RlmE/FtsJ
MNSSDIVANNYWYNDSQLESFILTINNQNIRIRQYNGRMLTPILTDKYKINRTDNMTLYQPYYPETFYDIWEIIRKYKIQYGSAIYLGNQLGLGALESVMINKELKYTHYWLNTSIHIDSCNYTIFNKKIDRPLCLEQTFVTKEINNEMDLKTYDLILIDCMNLYSENKEWNTINKDICDSAYMLSLVYPYKTNSTIIIKIYQHNIPCGFMNFINKLFREVVIYKPTTSYNTPIIYLICSSVNTNYTFTMDLIKMNIENDFIFMNGIVSLDVSNIRMSINKWSTKYDMPLIKDLVHNTIDNFEIELGSKISAIKNNKNKLFFIKRVLDTKPNNLYTKKIYYREYISWDTFTSNLNPYTQLKYYLKKEGISKVTNAWLKMYEILNKYNFLSNNVVAFHICEAPGAFISATNWYCRKNNYNYKFYGQTLRKTETNGAVHNSDIHWLYGHDGTGNIMSIENLNWYENFMKDKKINFVTADGGINLPPNKMNNQSKEMSDLFSAQVDCIFRCLNKNGMAVIKFFSPSLEKRNIKIIYQIYKSFANTYIFKPKTSNSSNSEYYLVCISYLGKILDDNKTDYKIFIKKWQRYMYNLMYSQVNALNNLYYNYYYPETITDNNTNAIKNWLIDNPIY